MDKEHCNEPTPHPYRHGCPICHITKTRLPFCIHRKHQRIIAMMALFRYERDLIEHLAGELGDLAQDFAEPQRHGIAAILAHHLSEADHYLSKLGRLLNEAT